MYSTRAGVNQKKYCLGLVGTALPNGQGFSFMDKQLISYAEDYLIAGLSVIPIKSGEKRPAIPWEQYQKQAIDIDNINVINRADSDRIGVVCGKVSGGLECLDFDNKDNDVERLFIQFCSDNNIQDRGFYAERTPSGGFHLVYKYESDKYDGNQKLTTIKGKCLIETRAEGGQFVAAPSNGYVKLFGDLCNIVTILENERNNLISYCRNLSDVKETNAEVVKQSHHITDPVSWFNWHKEAFAKNLLKDAGWSYLRTTDGVDYYTRPGKTDGSVSATFNHKHGMFYVFSSSEECKPFQHECYYTPFQILILLKFNGESFAALQWVNNKYFDNDSKCAYIRVGVDYFKRITKVDRFGIKRHELKKWTKDEIKEDHGKNYIKDIQHYDDFVLHPDNINYMPVVNGSYNLYGEFSHLPSLGAWNWTRVLLEHVFGDQFDMGIKYLQVLYQLPQQPLPVLVLVSKERSTGKSTFFDWLMALFGTNMVIINPEDITSSFNSIYAYANIIGIEETFIEKQASVEKIKSLSTLKTISVNMKFVQNFKLPFFGKIIMASNNVDKFMKIDNEEIRFWVRKLNTPTITNHNILNDMISEIPAFLHHLTTLPKVDTSKSRMVFLPEELKNDTLEVVKKESHSYLYQELTERFQDWFMNHDQAHSSVYCTALDIKEKFYLNNSQVRHAQIRNCLRDEFQLKTVGMVRYQFWNDEFTTKSGTPYLISYADVGL